MGPLTSIGSAGKRPAAGPGSAAFDGNDAVKEFENTPDVTIAEINSKYVES
jgi:hypothetical protein